MLEKKLVRGAQIDRTQFPEDFYARALEAARATPNDPALQARISYELGLFLALTGKPGDGFEPALYLASAAQNARRGGDHALAHDAERALFERDVANTCGALRPLADEAAKGATSLLTGAYAETVRLCLGPPVGDEPRDHEGFILGITVLGEMVLAALLAAMAAQATSPGPIPHGKTLEAMLLMLVREDGSIAEESRAALPPVVRERFERAARRGKAALVLLESFP